MVQSSYFQRGHRESYFFTPLKMEDVSKQNHGYLIRNTLSISFMTTALKKQP